MEGIPESFELHPLYQASFALTVWIDQIFDEHDELQNHPSAVKLATNSAMASAKLAAALSDDDAEEIGMTIAYLKRALKAISNAIDANLVFVEEAKLSSHRRRQLHARLFHVRDGIIELMGDYRNEWRRRHGRAVGLRRRAWWYWWHWRRSRRGRPGWPRRCGRHRGHRRQHRRHRRQRRRQQPGGQRRPRRPGRKRHQQSQWRHRRHRRHRRRHR